PIENAPFCNVCPVLNTIWAFKNIDIPTNNASVKIIFFISFFFIVNNFCFVVQQNYYLTWNNIFFLVN
ncbi:MAG: hypothetical protein B6I20_07575, partial [Bacteroidetes bacterium 4572_117]